MICGNVGIEPHPNHRGIRMDICTDTLYRALLLHANVEDWLVTHCDMG